MAEGRVITLNDSVKTEPGLARTVLQGLALPNDMDMVPSDLMPSLVHLSAYVVQAGQAALKVYQQAEVVSAERGRLHEDLKVEREKSRSYKGSLKTAKTQIAELEKEAKAMADFEKEKEAMAAKLKKAERELGKVLAREKRKMKEVDEKAYQAGFDRAGAEYIRQARAMVNEEIEQRIPIAYRTGYKHGVKASCEALNLEADTNMYKSIPAPVVPELELPYTSEECEPLPPEEFSDSEGEVEDLTLSDDGADGNGLGAKSDAGGVKGGEGGEKIGGTAEGETPAPEKVADVEAGTSDLAGAVGEKVIATASADVAAEVAP